MTTALDPTLPPLCHPRGGFPFRWGGREAWVHYQRKEGGSTATHVNWFYLELPDGSFHEVQLSRLSAVLDEAPRRHATSAIAHALMHESDQSPERLLAIAKACGLD